MKTSAVPAALEGGYITHHEFDLVSKTLDFRVELLRSGALSVHDVRFASVSELAFRDELGSTWERLELREISIDESPAGSASEEWAVWMNFWDSAELRLKCSRILIDGTAVD